MGIAHHNQSREWNVGWVWTHHNQSRDRQGAVHSSARDTRTGAFLMNRIAELGSGSRAAWAWAVVLSSLAFGAAHYTWGFAGMVQPTFMGLALGVSYLVVGRNLWVTILAHGYMDTMLLLQMYFAAGPVVTE